MKNKSATNSFSRITACSSLFVLQLAADFVTVAFIGVKLHISGVLYEIDGDLGFWDISKYGGKRT